MVGGGVWSLVCWVLVQVHMLRRCSDGLELFDLLT